MFRSNKTPEIRTKIIQDAANFISLPREALIHGDDNTVKVEAAELSETSMCNKCNVYITNCSCRKMCNTCQEWFSIVTDCRCTTDYIASLKTRITHDMSDEKDVIAVEDQTDVSGIIEDKFDAFSLVPPDIGTTVDLTHIGDPTTRELVESLITAHDKAFSAHKYDVGHFLGFEAQLDCTPGSSVIERERTMKPQVTEDLKPIIKDLLAAGIIRKASQQGPF